MDDSFHSEFGPCPSQEDSLAGLRALRRVFQLAVNGGFFLRQTSGQYLRIFRVKKSLLHDRLYIEEGQALNISS